MEIIQNCTSRGGINYMRIKKFLLVALLAIIILASCHQNDDQINQDNNNILDTQDINKVLDTQVNNDTLDTKNNKNDFLEENLDVEYNYTISGDTADEFSSLITNNPIDLRRDELLKNYDGSSRMIIEISSKYKEFWHREMEVAYTQLMSLLDEEDQQSLVNSQTSWESYMENKKHIEESFYNEQKYDVVGTLRVALTVEENAKETKLRAYSLLEYLYIITGEIKMVFSDDEW